MSKDTVKKIIVIALAPGIAFYIFLLIWLGAASLWDWTMAQTFWALVGLIIGILAIWVYVRRLTKRAKKNRMLKQIESNTWPFPVDETRDYFSEHPTCSVDDGIRHVLEKSGVPEQYHAKYRNDAEIKRKVEEIRKAAYAEWEKAEEAKRQEEAAKKRARLAEKMKEWEQNTAKYTRYANLKGREKAIQYCKDRIAYYDKVRGNYTPENMYKAQYKIAELTNDIYKASAQREHDWALHGGIAEGIAGPAAGVATALNIQRENEQIRAQNAALGKQIGDMNAAYGNMLREQETILYTRRWKWYRNLNVAQKATIKQEDMQKLMEILAPKVSVISAENELHVLEVWIRTCSSYDISKALSKIGYEHAAIDGSIKMTIQYNGKVIGTPIGVMPFGGTAYSTSIVATCKIPDNINIPYEEKEKVQVTFAPRDLWIVQNAPYEVYSDRDSNYDLIEEIKAYE